MIKLANKYPELLVINGSSYIVFVALSLITLYFYAIIQLVLSFRFNSEKEVMFRFASSVIAFEIPNFYYKTKQIKQNYIVDLGKIDKHLDFAEYSAS